ncbi:ABC transporter transmembrane region 2-domain-containing protein [Endogone sp. FLAS-F59071]|nr:ABC transporter transmembrane region 2-domain-containing protein [Endogone sp. FLAS-F59071]|eukprot:RUS19090.1 ABC transporter transmembrane region 2-domain-containing protein [Endogone sp. FLAS-F59071]
MRLNYTPVPEDSAHTQAFEVPVIKDDDRSLDRLFLQRLLRILRLLFAPSTQGLFSRESRDRSVLWLYIAFVAISCLNEVIVYFVGMIPSRFYKVLVDKDAQGFGGLMIPTILLIAAAAVGKSLVKFMGGLFSLKIRRLLTEYLQNRFIQTNIFYRLLVMHESIDNPDQRITQDVDKFADTTRTICEDLIISPLLIIYYTYQCWRVGGVLGPLLIYVYFAIGSFSSRAFISPIVNVVFLKEFHEGNFRYQCDITHLGSCFVNSFLHIRLRQFAESIAFSRGEKEENVRLERSLNALLSYQRSIVNKELPLQYMGTWFGLKTYQHFLSSSVVTEGFSYFGSILSYLIIAIPIFAGRYDDKDSGELSSLISQSAFLSLYLIYRFTLIIEQSAKISDLAGYTARIGQLIEAISDIHSELENIDIDFPYQEDQAA